MSIRNNIRQWFQQRPQIKALAETLVMHPTLARPRWYVRLLAPLYQQRGRGSHIYSSVRMDTPPFRQFRLGEGSVIESFCCINNAVGDVTIGNHSRIGLHCTVIGPVSIGHHVHLAQGVVVTALNHVYDDPDQLIDSQGVTTRKVTIDDDVWIGAHAVILPGVTVGRHAVVAAGAVVTAPVPPFTVVAGVPARVIKHIQPNHTQQS